MRRLAFRFVALSVFFPVIGLPQTPPENPGTEEKLQAAESHLRDRQYQEAKDLLGGILRQSPGSFEANELMGLALASEGQEHDANPFFEKAARIQPDSAEAHKNLGTNLLHLKRVTPAEQEFKWAAVLKPKDYSINHDLGEFYISRGRLQEAVVYLQKAQEARPDSYANGWDLALAEIQSGMLQHAEKEIDALMHTRDTADLHAILAEVKEKQQDYLAAGREYQRAAQMDPSENNIFAWGAELLRHRTAEPAIQVLSHGVQFYPRSARLQIGLGIALFMREFYDRAVDAFCHAVDLDPKDSRPYYFLSKIYAISPSRAAEVTARLGQLVQIQPRNATARYYYAMSLWKAARLETRITDLPKVESLLRAAVALDPALAEAYLQLGILCAEEKKDSEALQHYETAVQLDPDLADAHYRLGQALLRSGDTVRGEKELKISSQLHTRQLNEKERLNSEILRFVVREPNSSP
jgi:Flp pilus assembly protein TadD